MAEYFMGMIKLKTNVALFDERFNRTMAAIFEANAKVTTLRMKALAPWVDRTGLARSGLLASATSEIHRHVMVLMYHVSYGIYLELARKSKRPIIIPIMPLVGRDLMRQLYIAMERAGNGR